MNNHYERPPVIECLIELFFPKHLGWTKNLADKLYSGDIQNNFPIPRPLKENTIEFTIEDDNSIQQKIGGVPRLRYLSQDNSAMIQFGDRLCIFNQLRPYPKHFLEVLEKAKPLFQHYLFVTDPSHVESIGVRYINQLAVSEGEKYNDYLNFSPNFPSGNSALNYATPFVLQASIPMPDKGGKIIISLAKAPKPNTEKAIYIFDLYGKLSTRLQPAWEQIQTEVTKIQNKLEDIFETSITDKARRSFGLKRD